MVSGFGLIQPEIESAPTRTDLGRIRIQFFHKLGRILDLSNFTDSDSGLGSALTLSQVWIWTWIQFLLQFGSDSESIKFNGFGFGLGFNFYYGSGRIQNPLSLTDLDLDSIFTMVWVGFRIH